ncbi:hypothetical protein WJX72_005398 [[Myrmecia] bisecta]|uniref:Uncharacterized protein n=1 Tax=[Myrmecia] bisecta TaxID=41462 RepID=A0AAW1Q749_9CHLO
MAIAEVRKVNSGCLTDTSRAICSAQNCTVSGCAPSPALEAFKVLWITSLNKCYPDQASTTCDSVNMPTGYCGMKTECTSFFDKDSCTAAKAADGTPVCTFQTSCQKSDSFCDATTDQCCVKTTFDDCAFGTPPADPDTFCQ